MPIGYAKNSGKLWCLFRPINPADFYPENITVEPNSDNNPDLVRKVIRGFFARYCTEGDNLAMLMNIPISELFYYALVTPSYTGKKSQQIPLDSRLLLKPDRRIRQEDAERFNLGIFADDVADIKPIEDNILGGKDMSQWQDPDIKYQFSIITVIRALLSGIRFSELRFLTGQKAMSGIRPLVTNVICSPVFQELQKLGIVTTDNQDQFWINAMRILFDETIVTVLKCPPDKLIERYLSVVAMKNQQNPFEPKNNDNKPIGEDSQRQVGDPINISAQILIPFYVSDYSSEESMILPRVAIPYLLDYINAIFDVLIEGLAMGQNIALTEFLKLIKDVDNYIINTMKYYGISEDSSEFKSFNYTHKRLRGLFWTFGHKGDQYLFVHE